MFGSNSIHHLPYSMILSSSGVFNYFPNRANPTYGTVDHYITQFLSGHGAYRQYPHRFKSRDTPTCPCNKDLEDAPHHTLFLLPKTKKKLKEETKYRPICILNAFSKISESIIQERLLQFVSLSDRQVWFS